MKARRVELHLVRVVHRMNDCDGGAHQSAGENTPNEAGPRHPRLHRRARDCHNPRRLGGRRPFAVRYSVASLVCALFVSLTTPAWATPNCSAVANGTGADAVGGVSTKDTASVDPQDNVFLVIYLVASRAATTFSFTSVSGLGLTWAKVPAADVGTPSGPYRKVSAFRTYGASPTTGAVTINTSDNYDTLVWGLIECTGADSSGTSGSGAVVQAPPEEELASSYVFDQFAAFGSGDNRPLAGVGRYASHTATAEGGWTKLVDQKAGTATHLVVVWRDASDDLTAGVTFSGSTTNMAVGIEVKNAPAASCKGALMMMGMGGC